MRTRAGVRTATSPRAPAAAEVATVRSDGVPVTAGGRSDSGCGGGHRGRGSSGGRALPCPARAPRARAKPPCPALSEGSGRAGLAQGSLRAALPRAPRAGARAKPPQGTNLDRTKGGGGVYPSRGLREGGLALPTTGAPTCVVRKEAVHDELGFPGALK